jgi:hypothetical protein
MQNVFKSILIIAGKHIEIQIFGDSSGNCISLFERECSIQRRHQKVIEEAPSPYMTPQLRAKMSAAATELGKLLRYEGAGTVEFIVDAQTGGFYFLEVNTRVQVKPPAKPNIPLIVGGTPHHRRNHSCRHRSITNLRRIRRSPQRPSLSHQPKTTRSYPLKISLLTCAGPRN